VSCQLTEREWTGSILFSFETHSPSSIMAAAGGGHGTRQASAAVILERQKTFNEQVLNGDKGRAFWHDPYRAYDGVDPPVVEKYYLKSVLLLAPHINFPGVCIPCLGDGCTGHIEKRQAAKVRVIHGMRSDVYVGQWEYKCSNGKNCKHETQSFMGSTVYASSRCPEFVRAATIGLCQLTQSSGVTGVCFHVTKCTFTVHFVLL